MMLSTTRVLCRRSITRSLLNISATGTTTSETVTVTYDCRSFATSRRRRPKFVATKYKHLEEPQELPDRGGLQQAFAPAEKDFGDYLAKASLSPWVPVPDPVARKMLEIAQAGPEDIHIELGSGDGRMNFHALDAPFAVKRSIGVDIDEQLVGVAEERLAKRHPAPTNIEFRVQDLMTDETSSAGGSIWKQDGDGGVSTMQEATVITMYFVQDALRRLKPKLEMAALPDGCRVVCCGYAMPEWEPDHVEVILDLPIYLYTTPFYKNRNSADDDGVHLTPAERMQLEEEDRQYRLSSSTSTMEKSFSQNSQDDDVEEIHVPLFDPATMIDGHWDDFDDEDEEDLDGNPAISKWRQPE